MKEIERPGPSPSSDQSRDECPDERWWSDDIFRYAADQIGAALEVAPVKNRISELPAALVLLAGTALLIAARRLEFLFHDLCDRYGIDRRIVGVALHLASNVSAKAAEGLTVGDVERLKGQLKPVDDWDLLDDDQPKKKPNGSGSGTPHRQEFREYASRAAWSVEGLDAMVARHGLPHLGVEDLVILIDRCHAAAQRLTREIDQAFSSDPLLMKTAGRAPRGRASRRGRKVASPETNTAPSNTRGAEP
jgi:hypothetical protein